MIPRLVALGAMVVGLVLALGFTGTFTQTIPGTPSPDPEVVEQVVAERFAASGPQLSAVDQVFLRTVRKGTVRLGQNADVHLVEAARSACASFDRGVSMSGLRVLYVQQGFDPGESSWFFGASIAAYCPQHANKIGS